MFRHLFEAIFRSQYTELVKIMLTLMDYFLSISREMCVRALTFKNRASHI